MTRTPLLGAVLALTIALAGCAAASSGGGSGGTTAGPAPDTTPSAVATPFSYPCADIIDAGTLASLDANLVPASSPAIQPGSAAAQAQTLKGIVCGWADPSGATLVISVAQLDAATLKSSEASVAAKSQPATYVQGAVPGYFANGEADVFTQNDRWISATSSLFTSAAAAQDVVEYVLQALPSGG